MKKDQQLTKNAFEHKWLKTVGNGNGFMRAYELVELEHFNLFGSQRYSGYKSFARSRDYKHKK